MTNEHRFHDVILVIPASPVSDKTYIEIDGMQLLNVKAVDMSAAVDERTTFTIEFVGNLVEAKREETGQGSMEEDDDPWRDNAIPDIDATK
jgi:hypothetical protein